MNKWRGASTWLDLEMKNSHIYEWHHHSSEGEISEHVRTLFGCLYILGGQ